MRYKDKIKELRNVINNRLIPFIDNDYIYLDLPYHSNLGDTLIWEGTLRFLEQLPYKCVYSTNIDYYSKPVISKDTIIILHGGGNWGDLWPAHHQFRKKVIEDFPENRVIVFPQSVYYQEQKNLLEDASFYNAHPNVIICLRDYKSYEILNKHFPNKLLLVPDMAFFVDISRYRRTVETNKILFATRADKELSEELELNIIPSRAEIHDWPTLDICPKYYIRLEKLHRCTEKVDHLFSVQITYKVIDFYWKNIIRPHNVKTAIQFLCDYSVVYSTRLHVSILSILLEKKSCVLDNNYAKTMNFLDTWFTKEEVGFFFNRPSDKGV